MAGAGTWRGRVAQGIGYTGFTLAVYLVSLLWLLPYPELARNLENRALRHGLALQIDGLGPAAPLGLKAERVHIAGTGAEAPGLQLTDARCALPVLGWVRGERAVDLRASALGGRVSGRYLVGDRPRVQATWAEIALDRLPRDERWRELPLAGTTSGTLEAEVDPDNPERITGRLDATVTGARVGAGKVQGFPVPEVALGSGKIAVAAQNGKIEIESAGLEGGDLGIDFKGNVLLRREIQRSLINGVLSLQPNEKAAEELALVFAVFPGTRSSDGRYTGRVRGSLGAPMIYRR